VIGLEIGYGLVPLVSSESGGQLMNRVKGVRKKLSAELGYLVQPVRIRDSLTLEPDSYRIIVNGVTRGKGEVKSGRELAISPGKVYGSLDGIPTKDPAFGLDAVWIDPAQRDYARTLGYTVVDAATALATHLNKVLRESASELLSHDETQQLLDKLAARSPKLVEELVPAKLSLGVVTKVLQSLLDDGVSIRDMRSIVEALSEACSKTQDPLELTSLPTYIMVAMSRGTRRAQEAAVKYFFLGALSTAIMVYGFAMLYGSTGSLQLTEIKSALASQGAMGGIDSIGLIGLLLVTLGLCFKLAAAPMHFYAPDVYEGAAAPVTGFLAFVPKIAGFTALLLV
ncbi:MAG: hypothetical protein EBR88_09685, partial [Betaproteobacteria bacterium]|nr:hypothetical protein [Betaproteobacteria bacterium]